MRSVKVALAALLISTLCASTTNAAPFSNPPLDNSATGEANAPLGASLLGGVPETFTLEAKPVIDKFEMIGNALRSDARASLGTADIVSVTTDTTLAWEGDLSASASVWTGSLFFDIANALTNFSATTVIGSAPISESVHTQLDSSYIQMAIMALGLCALVAALAYRARLKAQS